MPDKDPEELYRMYLIKMDQTARVGVQAREWRLDGEDKPSRNPVTWRELHKAFAGSGESKQENHDIHAMMMHSGLAAEKEEATAYAFEQTMLRAGRIMHRTMCRMTNSYLVCGWERWREAMVAAGEEEETH